MTPSSGAGPGAGRSRLGTRRQKALDTIYTGRAPLVSFPPGQRMNELYPFVRNRIGDGPITYLEFGVFRGNSLRRMTQLFTHPESRFIGFDSFEGLPQDWGRVAAGAFQTGGAPPVIADARVRFVKGYFQNTLPDFLASHRSSAPTLVHFDADLYSSTLFLLTSLWHHVPAYYFVFDEFAPDEVVAMYDFTRAYPVEYEFFAVIPLPEPTNLPLQLFGHMQRVPLVVAPSDKTGRDPPLRSPGHA